MSARSADGAADRPIKGALLLGWGFWGETLVLTTVLGTLLIIGAGIWNLKTR